MLAYVYYFFPLLKPHELGQNLHTPVIIKSIRGWGKPANDSRDWNQNLLVLSYNMCLVGIANFVTIPNLLFLMISLMAGGGKTMVMTRLVPETRTRKFCYNSIPQSFFSLYFRLYFCRQSLLTRSTQFFKIHHLL